jgi:cell division protein FtsI/penicillin-binding protein 2
VRAKAANRRIVVLAGAFAVLLAVALGRAFWLQAVNGDAYAAMAVQQHRETVVVPAGRGSIVDRNEEPLAIGRPATTVYANPRQVGRPREVTLAAVRLLGAEPGPTYAALTDRSRGFVYLARKADPVRAEELEELGFAGLGFYPEQRTHPQGSVAPQVLGSRASTTRARGARALAREGSRGPARKPDDRQDPIGRALDVVSTKPETPGRGVRLTLDRQIQANAEVVSGAVRRYGRGGVRNRHGSALGIGPRDGGRTALQRQPVPDNARRSPSQSRRDGHLRARLDVQARRHRSRAPGGCR